MTIEHQKKVADEVLDKIFPIDPFAIVAGGAPRDWYFGREASDIDVFLYHSVLDMKILEKMLHSVGLDVENAARAFTAVPEHYKRNPDLYAVFNTIVDGVKVQIMVMSKKTFWSVVPKFPISLCKIWYKKGQIRLTEDFLISAKHKVAYITNDLYADGDGYINKIKEKFPEFEWFNTKSHATDWVLLRKEQEEFGCDYLVESTTET